MQDIHSIGGSGRFFGGGTAGDRRLRPHHHHQNHQALKCPRCDSLNTKFCYYNNYNLSQPRHFCKSCRRYWTKGGVLRNVPVGGGCRKTKRSKPKLSSSSAAAAATSSPPVALDRKSNSHSSSESSSLTANNNNSTSATAATATTEAVSNPSTSSASNLLNNIHQDSKFFGSNPSFDSALLEQGSDCGIFSEIGSFTSLIASSSAAAETMPFGYSSNMSEISVSPFRLNQQQQGHQDQSQWQQQPDQNQKSVMSSSISDQELKSMQDITGGFLDQTAQVDLSRSNGGGGGFGSLGEWHPGGGDHVLFDLPNTVDHTYWSQTQWSDQDHPSLYLP